MGKLHSIWNRSGAALAGLTLAALLVRIYSLDGPSFWVIHRFSPRIESPARPAPDAPERPRVPGRPGRANDR